MTDLGLAMSLFEVVDEGAEFLDCLGDIYAGVRG